MTVNTRSISSLMKRLALGNPVRDVQDMNVGDVAGLLGCCFEVRSPLRKWNLSAASIFNVVDGRVTLICSLSELGQYACPIHRP